MDVVQINRHQFEEKYSFIEAAVGPVTCNPLKNQNVYKVKQNMEFICEQNLADFEDEESTHESCADILKDVNYYCNFFGGKAIKNSEGLVAFSTVLGWVLSGPITFRNSCFTDVCFEIHSMRCNIDNIEKKPENLETKNKCVIYNFERDIFHNGQRHN